MASRLLLPEPTQVSPKELDTLTTDMDMPMELVFRVVLSQLVPSHLARHSLLDRASSVSVLRDFLSSF